MNTQIEFVEALQNRFAIEHVKNNLHVNLTQMSKPYGSNKSPGQWLKTQPAKDYLSEISDMLKRTSADLLIVRKGGNPEYQGTWCTDYRIAMRFAQWLNPRFSLMVDTLIVDLMSKQLINVYKPALLQNASFNENQVFFTKLGKDMIKGYYTGGRLYFQMGKVLRFLDYSIGSGGRYYAETYGIGNTVMVDEGKLKSYYVSLEWIDELMRKTKLPQPFDKVKTLYNDLFNIARDQEETIEVTYKFTDKQMIELISIVNKRPFNRGRIMDALFAGKSD